MSLEARRTVFTGCEVAIEMVDDVAHISRCLFVDNGLAIDTGGLEVFVENCTFYRNEWAVSSAPRDSVQTLKSCIIWGSKTANVREQDKGYGPDVYMPIITFSDVEGGHPGRANIHADPMFFLPSADEPDLHLCAFSPCIDGGDPLSDYSNEPEPNGGRVNMGEYGNTWEATTSELVDTDADNMRDDWEIENFGNLERGGFGDADDDGLSDPEEYRYLSDPNSPDTDGDGLIDGDEVYCFGTDPIVADTDNDGTPDGKEVSEGTNPLDPWDAFTIVKFWIEDNRIHVVHTVQPRHWYHLESSFWPKTVRSERCAAIGRVATGCSNTLSPRTSTRTRISSGLWPIPALSRGMREGC